MKIKIPQQSRDAIAAGNRLELLKVLQEEKEAQRDFMETCNLEGVLKQTQGKCQILGDLIKLLK